MKCTFVLTALLLGRVFASPASVLKRDADSMNNLPSGDKDCNSHFYSPSDIREAVNLAWQAVKDGSIYSWTHPQGKKTAEYPHSFTPTQLDMQWSDFNLDGCATGPNDALVSGFQEYPITPGVLWKGGNDVQGNDRVIFQYTVDSMTAAFCGIVRHPGKDGVDNHFQMCEDSNTSRIAPYSVGACSLHLTQWDYFDSRPVRYDVEAKIFDDAKKQIGFQSRTPSQGDTPVAVPSLLEDDLIVTAESENDYIAFSLPQQNWPSNGDFGPGDAHDACSVGGWDGSDQPSVGLTSLYGYGPMNDLMQHRQMDCTFGCDYHGGESSINSDDAAEG